MADEVPACDVLCEAMDYLAKLGSNLRSRSESLKEKKIRKERLKNSHAVQKAAQKVLMICELSRKSLENVEIGVKKVLSTVDASQRSDGDGAKKSRDKERKKPSDDLFSKPNISMSNFNSSDVSNKTHLSSPRRISVSGKSYVLRIPRKISLKHYMSLKVLAKPLPKSMIQKYPVYYNCKLLHERGSKSISKLQDSSDESHRSSGLEYTTRNDKMSPDIGKRVKIKDLAQNNDNGSIKEKCDHKCAEREEPEIDKDSTDINSKNRRMSETDICLTENKEIDSDKHSKKRRVSETDKYLVKRHKTEPDKHSKMIKESDTDKTLTEKEKMESDKDLINKRETKTDKDLNEGDKIDSSKYPKKSTESETGKCASEKDEIDSRIKRKESESDKLLKGRSLSSPDKENHSKKNIEQAVSSTTKRNKDTDKGEKESAKKSKKKYRKVRVLDTSSSENEEAQNKEDGDVICIDDEVEVQTMAENIRTENKENLSQTSDTEPTEKHVENNSKKVESTQGNMDEPAKPLIKCVSITKLLKPDILETEHNISQSKPSSVLLNETSFKTNTKLIVHMTTKGELKERYYQESIAKSALLQKDSSLKKIKKVRYQDEEEFWEQKRKEVKAFMPKKFYINVRKLPKYSQSFLNHNNLKRITQCGIVVYELLSETTGDKENGKGSDSLVEKSSCSPNQAKNALLNDSDDDIPPVTLSDTHTYNAESIKKYLLDKPDLNKNEVYPNNKKSIEDNANEQGNKKSLENKKKSRLSKQTIKENDKAKNTKSSLLEDPDSDKNENQDKTQSNVLDKRKKSADEKEKVKSSLLEDSDSDKNENQGKTQCHVSNKNKKAADKTEKVKSSLLEDSDSDKNENQDKTQSHVSDKRKKSADEKEKVKSSLLEDSDSDENESQDKTQCHESDQNKKAADKTEKVKSSLLEDSDSDENGSQDKTQCQVKNQSKKAADKTEKVKSSLLEDSDSDKNGNHDKTQGQVKDQRKKAADKTEKGKSSLLEDSDSDKNGNQDKTQCQVKDQNKKAADKTEKVKSSLPEDSDSDKNGNPDKTQHQVKDQSKKAADKTEKVKSSLLEDSDSDKNGNPDKIPDTVEDPQCQVTDQGKKTADKTEKVKSSLLEDSDSDKNQNQDTTQCQVKDQSKKAADKTVKVKSSLLEDSDSDKNGNPDETQCQVTDQGKKTADKTEKIKSSLLEDSDSDKNQNQYTIQCQVSDHNEKTDNETEKVKSSLLEDLESDRNDDQDQRQTLTSEVGTNKEKYNAEEALMCDMDHEKNKSSEKDGSAGEQPECSDKEEQANNNAGVQSASKVQSERHSEEQENDHSRTSLDLQDKELAKSSLLNDSSDGGSKPESKKERKSKRKHIMESMHAKKMLLTYSSSSDTEDEQLKSVIKDMKDDLLKNIEENDAKNSLKRKMLSTSESDEDVVTKKIKVADECQELAPNKDEEIDKEGHKTASAESSDSSLKKSKSRSAKMGRSREKPGGSSSQNSDQEDKDIEGLTNLKTLNKTGRARDSANKSAATRSSSRRMAKAPKVFTENLLAPESSDSAAESDGPEEDLPPVSMVGFNGDGIDHLAKDDLLEESESDHSKNNSSDAVKKEDDSDSSTVKAKRRKGQTISSDSEAGSSRRKNANAKISDFEDSEEESSEPVKNAKRKKKGSDSDASGGSSEAGKKKRRRIKQIDSDDDDDGSGSDSENEGKSKHGRKNIRKVMGKNQLEEATKKAAREEKERLARIAERQKMYNNLEFDESGKPDEVIVDKVVLDFDPETKEPLIEVDRGLVKKLKPHQANGIKFMWDACFESAKRIKKDKGSGCILAHCMGLGKTLQVVSLTHTLLTHSDLTNVDRVLVVCPLSTVLNWVNEFRMWLKHANNEPDVDVYELSRYKQNSERAFQLSQWFQHGGVCVLGYEMFRNLSADNPKKFKKKMLKQFQESLVDPGPDLVVCDEGHLLKNEKTSLSQSMNRVKTRRRIVLTGTPLQNNLKEYYCMVQFVKPNLLGKYNEYLNRFVNPITNGQYTDSTEHDIRIMKRRSHVLHKMLDGAVQRRDYGVLAPFLPPKHEYVLFITLAEVQTKLYQHYLDNFARRPLAGKASGFLFPDFQSLQRIWTHPLVLKYNSERYEIMQQKKREREEEDSEGSLVDFIDDDSTPEETSTEESSDDSSDMSDDSRKKSKKKKKASKKKEKKEKESKKESAASRRNTRANPVDLVEELGDPSIVAGEVKNNENPTEWWIPLVTEDELDDMRNSHKLVLLFEILRQCEAIGDKLLVFSQSLYSLDLIEHFLGKVDEATQEGRVDEKLGKHIGSWSPGIDYFRLDGSTSCENRSIWCKNFNREDNPRARLFLISTRAGGLGINLVAANRVVIFDVSWNPSHDVQSIFRVYRFGQKKPCYIYRFLAMGTMEEKIYERQVTKQAISKRVIDEQQIDRHYAENDLTELYKFEPTPPVPRPVPLVPKDRLFAEMLKEHESLIYKFHEHDSLLENKEEETLSEEERKAAWEDFENEKNRPPPQPFPNWPMHNGMPNMNLMAAQQQQLAYAALAGVLRKDMPALSDENIRQMLPLLYSSNPAMFGGYDFGLMQKLSEMYKYAQPGLMNPQMMNMNAGAGGGATGGSSALQYEPPWQRQQQQQQQMRLQQLMQQQQNQMGAKFYAGGLGSRDPVAMALQQQRAREIMLGGAGGGAGAALSGGAATGRPRGRPPLTPRAPPTASNDVVNLDSD